MSEYIFGKVDVSGMELNTFNQPTELHPNPKGFHNTLRVGFEPTREEPNGFQVHRLNHSAIAAAGDYISKGII